MSKGRLKYVPPRVLEELDNIMNEQKLPRNQPGLGFNKMVDYCRVGREIEKMKDRFFLKDLVRRRRR